MLAKVYDRLLPDPPRRLELSDAPRKKSPLGL